MKRTLLFFWFIFFLIPLYTQQYWIQKPSPTTKWLIRIQFVDTLFGWAAGDSGIIIHTSNSGQNWSIQNSGTLSFINDMMFIDRLRGWVIANDNFNRTKILKTTNGGLNWQISNSPDSTGLFESIYFYDQQTGYLGGFFPGKIFKTTNGGSNWFETRIDTNSCQALYSLPKYNFSFLNAQTGFVSGGQMDLQGMIWKTTDSGMNWFTYCVAPEPLIRVKALYSHKTISVGGDFENGLNIVQTVDSGRTWLFYHPQNIFGIAQALAFRTPSELWMPTGFGQKWVLSLDSGGHGKNLFVIPCTNNAAIYDAMFVTSSFGWACGNDGILLKYNSDIIGISENGNTVPVKCVLFQNYPNPFNPVTTISYILNQKAFVRIIIYDAVGKEVYSHVEGLRQEGMHEIIFSAENLASGIYIYKIEAGDFSEAKKMVIIK